jgi:hypothetical protein
MVDVYVTVAFDATWPDAAGTGQEKSLASRPAGDLHAPVLATLVEFPLYVGGGAKKILTSWLQIDSRRALAQATLLRFHARKTKLVSYKGFSRNSRATPTRPETRVRLKLDSRPTKGIPLSNNSSIRRICTHIRCCSHRVGGKRSDTCRVEVANRLWLCDRGTHVEESFESTSVNTKDLSRFEKGTYMGRAWTKDREDSVAQQGKSMSRFQFIGYLLDLYNLIELVGSQMPPSP